MARKKNNSSNPETDLTKNQQNNASTPVDDRAIEDKLQAAAGNISRAHDDSKARDDELARRRKEAAKEKRARDAELEKQKRNSEKELRKQTEARLAELEYAESYRKKLQKEKQRADAEKKLREKEAKDAEQRAAEEASAKRIAEILEAERNEARRRSERAEALLNHVNAKKAAAEAEEAPKDQNSELNEQDEQRKIEDAVFKAVQDAEQENADSESEQAPPAGDTEDNGFAENLGDDADESEEAEEEIAEDDTSEDDTSEDESEETSDGDGAITVSFERELRLENHDVEILYSGDPDSDAEEAEEVTEEDADESDEETDGDVLGDVAKWFARTNSPDKSKESKKSDEGVAEAAQSDDDDDDPLDMLPALNSGGSGGKKTPGDRPASDDDGRRIPRRKRRDAMPITDEVLEQSDIVKDIRAQGKRLVKIGLALKNYAESSKQAINDLTKALKEGRRALDMNRDERHTPEIIVNLLKIAEKIIEIRCDNLENYTRLKANDYIKDARISLRRDINDYNELVVAYSVLTGEQLTRFSTLLPDNIASGKALAVIPSLDYKESYVQVCPDEDGKLPCGDGSILTAVIPMETADTVLEPYDESLYVFGFGGYIKQARRAINLLHSHTENIMQTLSKTNEAERRYKNALKAVERKYTADKRDSDEYRRAVLKVRTKYGKLLTSIKTSKVKYAFAKTKARLLVGCLSVERERLVVAYRLLREAYDKGRSSHKMRAERIFMEAVASYNRYAQQCEKATGVKIDVLPTNILKLVTKKKCDYTFPVVAYKRVLIETVQDTSRTISMSLKDSLESNEGAYAENSRMVLNGSKGVRDRVSLSDEAPMVDRASSVAKVVIDTLREYADEVSSADEFDLYVEKSARAVKFFSKSIKRTEKAIVKAFDENGVVAALVENLRVISNLIEVRRINIALATRLKHPEFARGESRSLYKEIELYNGRAIDYMSIVGEQFTRITTAPINVLAESADKLRIPQINYRDNYIEVFPKDPLEESLFEKPTQRRGGYYTPLLMKHFRLTENRAVETTVVNSPFVFDVTIDDMPVVSWWHSTLPWPLRPLVIFQPIVAAFRRISTNSAIWFVQTSLELSKSGLDNRGKKSDAKRRKLEAKLAKLEKERSAKLLALASSVHESDRNTAAYHKKINAINAKYSSRICKVKMRWMQECPAQSETRRMLERLVLDRELLIGVNKLLIKYRNYGRITFSKNVITKFKQLFLDAINDHNETARKLSELVGVEFSEVSSTVAEEIVRYGNMIRFPQVVCCREIIETVGDVERSVGDKWHGYGLYTQNPGGSPAGAPPIMSVGAMGYSTEMGIPYFNADFNSMSIIGMTPKGVPLIGFNNSGEAAIPFSGIPMMMKGEDDSPVLDAGMVGNDGPMLGGVNVANPYSSINSGAIDSIYVDNIEERAKNGATAETPIDIETAMVEERFLRSLGARAMTTVDGVGTWWRLIGSEINLMLQRMLFLDSRGFLRILLPGDDDYLENVTTLVPKEEKQLLARISKLSSIISIEISRLYSATKAGIRRSQRRFSAWLTRDIELYNKLVARYNKLAFNPNHSEKRRENEKLQPLSYSIPDRIRHRLDDRPPNPPRLRFRNRVRTAPFGWSQETPADSAKKNRVQRVTDAIDTGNMIDKLYEFVNANWFKHSGALRYVFCAFVLLKRAFVSTLYFMYKKWRFPCEGMLINLLRTEVDRRTKRTYSQRNDNETRHYFIRYEKARAMKRYNKRMLGAIGVANDPIDYQKRVHGVLRQYVSTVFRIDYNMRIYQLINRMLRISWRSYLIVLVPLLALMVCAGLWMDVTVYIWISLITACWAALPIALFLLNIVYMIVFSIVTIICFLCGNKQPLTYGAKDVESNRYSLILDCFVCEQYRVLAYATSVTHNPSKKTERMKLIEVINEYNKCIEDYSKMLRVNITKIEPTSFIDKLLSKEKKPLTELQNFYYVRELIQINGEHDVGRRLGLSEMSAIRERLNRYIGYVGYGKSEMVYEDLLEFTQKLGNFIEKMSNDGMDSEARELSNYIKAALAGYDFISHENRSRYRETLNKLATVSLNKRKRKKLAEELVPLENEVAAVRDVLSEDAVERFMDNTRLVLNERAGGGSGFTDEERFRVKEEIVSFVEKYPIDKTMIREEIARDFVKFIDDVGGTPERVIITSLALDNMIY